MIIDAKYSAEALPSFYRGNPLIEALPAILTREQLDDALMIRPALNLEEIRRLPYGVRIHALSEIDAIFVPRPELAQIESEIGLLMRGGYMRRNPLLATATQDVYTVRDRIKVQGSGYSPLPPCLIVTALSGSGKTRSIRIVLSLTPQVIRHRKYQGKRFAHTQITWLSIDAPISGSPKGLLLRAFAAVDEALGIEGKASYVNQFGRAKISVDQKIEEFAQIASTFHLGALHIDDLQRLTDNDAKHGRQVLNLLIQLANVVKVPLIFSGTHRMARAFAGSMEAARRVSAGDTIDLPPPASPDDPHFVLLVQALELLQVMDQPVRFDQDWRQELHKLSFGIPAILLSLIIGAQKIALRERASALTLEHLRRAYKTNCALLEPALNALKVGDAASYLTYEDLLPARAQLEAEHAHLYNAGRRKVAAMA